MQYTADIQHNRRITMDYQAICDMSKNGSAFESKLADLYMVADLKNGAILMNAFGDTFKKWEELSAMATETVWNLQHSHEE
jgi:hypothetical protein